MNEIRQRLQIFIALFVSVALVGTFGFMYLENLSFIDAFYFNITTMSTVGYGDIHPTREVSRLFAVLLIVMGGATFLGLVANGSEMMLLKRERQERMKKINMVLGVFYSEIGNHLLSLFSSYDPEIESLSQHLLVKAGWTAREFRELQRLISQHNFTVDMTRVNLVALHDLLAGRRNFLVRLLENPVLIEHEAFAETLLAIFHLTEELSYRPDLCHTTEADGKHLSGDISRAYQSLLNRWLYYMENLEEHYPYLFSLALRINPFDPKASPVLPSSP
jgi:hypothetical protein